MIKRLSLVASILLVALSVGQAATVFDSGNDFLTADDPQQDGRLSRNNVIADWSSIEPFPGLINTGTLYNYTEYEVSAAELGYYQYIQISMDSVGTNTFAAAYLGSYNPDNPAATYLGDPGTSGNFFGTVPLTFQVIVPTGNDLIVVVNQTGTNGVGLGDPFRILVEGFTDTNFSETPATPEPTTLSLGLGSLGAALVFGFVRRKRLASPASR